MKIALLALVLLAPRAFDQTSVVGDAWIIGPVMVGTNTASGSRMNVEASSAAEVPFQVSGVDLTPFLRVGKDGKVGLSTYSAANLDVSGSGDSEVIALQLRSGNLHPSTSGRAQIAFGQDGSANRRHHIDSVHIDSTAHNALNFLIWSPDAGTTSLATMTVLSLVTISTSSGASVHVRPADDPVAELTVSNGNGLGLGTVHTATQVTPSSREWKSDIAYLGDSEAAAAYDRVRSLKHVSFRYARRKATKFVRDGKAPVRRGLIYEDAPQVLRGQGESLSVTQRLIDSELAFKELAKRLEAFGKEIGP
ncbi:MAG: hypothetical protein A2506_11935 [Elusimicrobia bacterium RIFOXYD12_FULL_66_9]|nr:MAG: hypothetical protein A2506_11935 [Elusimicrobia bacterium RIFOXYD12_FULL_66_9]